MHCALTFQNIWLQEKIDLLQISLKYLSYFPNKMFFNGNMFHSQLLIDSKGTLIRLPDEFTYKLTNLGSFPLLQPADIPFGICFSCSRCCWAFMLVYDRENTIKSEMRRPMLFGMEKSFTFDKDWRNSVCLSDWLVQFPQKSFKIMFLVNTSLFIMSSSYSLKYIQELIKNIREPGELNAKELTAREQFMIKNARPGFKMNVNNTLLLWIDAFFSECNFRSRKRNGNEYKILSISKSSIYFY